MSISTFILTIGIAAQGSVSTESGVTDQIDLLARARLETEQFEAIRAEAAGSCSWSRSPSECQIAFVAATYSATNSEVCRERILLRMPYRHGGVVASYEEEEIRQVCGETIRLCRDNWQHFYDLSSAREDLPRAERREQILSQNLRTQCFQPPE